eukprot:5497196-Amphidinium_carterae.1
MQTCLPGLGQSSQAGKVEPMFFLVSPGPSQRDSHPQAAHQLQFEDSQDPLTLAVCGPGASSG